MLPLWVAGHLDAFICFPPGFDSAKAPAKVFAPFNAAKYPAEQSYADELRELANAVRPDALRFLPGSEAPHRATPSRPWFRKFLP
jgi:hypothetical protein